MCARFDRAVQCVFATSNELKSVRNVQTISNSCGKKLGIALAKSFEQERETSRVFHGVLESDLLRKDATSFASRNARARPSGDEVQTRRDRLLYDVRCAIGFRYAKNASAQQ